MKIKAGNLLFDSETIPIMLILSPEEKKHLQNMESEATTYMNWPKGYFKDHEDLLLMWQDVKKSLDLLNVDSIKTREKAIKWVRETHLEHLLELVEENKKIAKV